MTQSRTQPRLATLILLTGLTVLNLNMFLPALPAMTRDFGTTQEIMGLAVSGYMLMAAVMQLTLGPISDRIGRRPVLLAALLGYVIASLVCVLATNTAVFLVARLAQSCIVAGAVLSSAVIRDIWGKEDAASRLGTVAAAMAIAPMIGPAIGGVIDSVFGWRMVFVLYLALGAAALALSWIDLGETRVKRTVNHRLADYGALLGSRQFWAYAMCMTFSVGAFYVFVTGSPFVATTVFGLSSAWVGIGIGSITGGFMVGATLTARFSKRLGIARMIMIGRVLACASLCLGLLAVVFGLTHPLVFYAAVIPVGLGNGLTIANANAGALSVRPDLAGTAAGLAGAAMVAFGAALTWLTLALLGDVPTPRALLGIMLGSAVLSFFFGWVVTYGPWRDDIDTIASK